MVSLACIRPSASHGSQGNRQQIKALHLRLVADDDVLCVGLRAQIGSHAACRRSVQRAVNLPTQNLSSILRDKSHESKVRHAIRWPRKRRTFCVNTTAGA